VRIATIRGIPVRLHPSFLLLAGGWMVWRASTGGVGAAADAALLGVVVFGSVLLHELGHALEGRRHGVRTRDITLFPFGGVAAMEGGAMHAAAELRIALAGPLVNLLIAAVAFGMLLLGLPLAAELLVINLGMGAFNLLPASPMDGGRVLRAWWSRRRGAALATRDAVAVGRWFAWAFVVVGVFAAPSLALVGAFLLLAQRGETSKVRSLGGGSPVGHKEPPPLPRSIPQGMWSHPVR
jgi:Zn-dependent protease